MTKVYCDKCGTEIMDDRDSLEAVKKYPEGYYELIARKPYKDSGGATQSLGYYSADLCPVCLKALAETVDAFFPASLLVPEKWYGTETDTIK